MDDELKVAAIEKVKGRYLVVTKTAVDALGRERADEVVDVTLSVDAIAKREVEWYCGKAVGKTPEDAIKNLSESKGWGNVEMGAELESDPSDRFDWGFRFHAGGTSFKAAGVNMPGGCVLTWWK